MLESMTTAILCFYNYNRLGRDAEEADAEEIIEMAVEVTNDNREAAQEAKGKAMEALSEGNFDEAIEHPTSAIMYGNRGEY
ncbi:hypothetical protein YC2023_101972 [Brassica napus]